MQCVSYDIQMEKFTKMSQRNASTKNEMTGIENDPLEKTLTYATAAKRRHTKLSVHSRSIISTSADLIIGTTNITNSTNRNNNINTTTTTNNNNNNNNNSSTNSNHSSLIGSNDAFIHAPLQAVRIIFKFQKMKKEKHFIS
ncbi:hypothetical protein WUBG_16011 [Wuchereria bancrofti]|uniref:Uncharacterized protein n=1 Tax=Wuchereria bancrofti TaxID=6293 RepID=J9E802_WUCBA|nr:hypothetical protein WUBG_16011 [Wuchereria bancrofti]